MIRVRGLSVGLLMMSASAAAAQTAEPPRVERQVDVMIVHGPGQAGVPLLPPGGADLDFVSMPLAIGGDTVTGAPYSAEAVTDVVQTLADGNRIARQSKASVYRDAAGRTRREQGLTILGNVVGGASDRKQVQLHDPQAGTIYILDIDSHEAHRLPSPKVNLSWAGAAGPTSRSTSTFELPVPPPVAGGGQTAIFMRRNTAAAESAGRVEQLGTRFMEGVEAEGTRSTMTIPAGQIGNDLPIEIVSERWFSPTLKVLVMSRQSDPRFGETTYRLTNITRTDPSPDLFEVPPDFKIIDAPPGPGAVMRLEKRQP